MRRFIDLTRKKFGRLHVICQKGFNKHGYAMWKCRCDCGNIKIVLGGSLRTGHTKSCGCYQRERSTRHGLSKTSEHSIWQLMLQRCGNPKAPNYRYYGARGITVCERWKIFENFFSDMGRRPDPSLSIERRNNEKGYYPENCYWATRIEQARNRRPKTRTLTKGIDNNEKENGT